MKEEFQHVQRWSAANKLKINVSKTKEIIFRRQCTRRFTVPQPLQFIEQVTVTKHRGIYIYATFSTVTRRAHPYCCQPTNVSTYTAEKSGAVTCSFRCLLYLMPLYCQLLRMLFHHLRDSY